MALDAAMPDLTGMVVGAAASRPDTISGLDAEFQQSFQKMLRNAPEYVRKELKITSGYRSPELQEQLWRDALKKYGSAKEARKWVAPPGKSQHNKGTAKDLSFASDRTREWVHKNAGNYGLAFPLKNEPWHMELATARKRDLQVASAAQPDVQGAAGDDQMTGQAAADTPPSNGYADTIRAAYQAFNEGRMTPEDETQYIQDVLGGTIEAPGPLKAPAWLWDAYSSGQMEDADRQQFEADVQAGVWSTPPQDMGMLESVGSLITGSGRRIESTEALPDISEMPEWSAGIRDGIEGAETPQDFANQMISRFESGGVTGRAGALMAAKAAPPAEKVQILQKQFPGVEIRQDAAGNYIVKSSIDGKEYAIKPGVRASDIPGIAAQTLAFAPVGRGGSLAGAATRASLIESGIQETQERAGGEANIADVAFAGAGEAGGRLLAQGVRSGARAIGRASGMGSGAATPSPSAAAAAAPSPSQGMSPADLGDLIRQASRGGRGSEDAVRALVAEAQINPRAAAAAERLGITVPPDVLVDNPMVREAAGLTRSIAGSEAAVNFDQAIKRAIDQADDAFRQIDASPDIGAVSEKVRTALQSSEKAIRNQAGKLFDRVRDGIDQAATVDTPALQSHLDEVARVMGGVDDMDPALKKLYERVTKGDVTYGWLDTLRRDIGRGYARTGPYADSASRDLDLLYGALARDQADAVRMLGGDELLDTLQQANRATGLYKELQERIVSAFGKDLEGSIANRLRAAITNAGKGDSAALSRIIKVIPPELRKEALATAIAAASRSSRDGQRGFGFSQFSQFYTGLKANKPVFNQVMTTLGPDAARFMEDLAEISARITEARGNVITTGKANQALVQALTAEGLVERALGSTILRRGAQAAGGAGGAMAGGGFGAAAGAGLAGVIADIAQNAAHKDALQAAGRMFGSQQFKDVVEEAAANPQVADRAVRRLARSAAYRRWAKAINNPDAISRPERFIINLIQAARQQAQQSTGEDE